MRRLSTRAAGLLIMILGIWGGLVPFIGPYFHFTLGPTKSWTWTTGRWWLDVLPAIVAVVGGLMLLGSGPRPGGKLGALLALAAGIWFAIGPTVSLLWASNAAGTAHGAKFVRVLEMLTYHTLLGVLIAALAGYALPGLVTRRAALAEAEADADAAPAAAAATAGARRRPLPGTRGDAAPVAAGAGAGAAGEDALATRQHRPIERDGALAERDAAVAAEPATRREPIGGPAPASADGAGATAAGDPVRSESRTAVMDRPAPQEQPAAPAADGSATGAATGSTADSAADAPVTVRRRRGGLFSRLRS